jgi:hypothetical protein
MFQGFRNSKFLGIMVFKNQDFEGLRIVGIRNLRFLGIKVSGFYGF